jgi:hypothetical protein
MMIRRALLLLTIAGIYIALKKRHDQNAKRPANEHAADANWANEGGANAPASV